MVKHASAFADYQIRNRDHFAPWEPERTAEFYTPAHQEAAILRSTTDPERTQSFRFVGFERSSPDIVVSVNLWNVRRGVIHAAAMGYSTDCSKQGRGYVTEAAAMVIRYAFDVLNLHRLEATYQPQNERSGRVLRRLGFAVEGYARDYLWIGGRWRDAILVGMTNPLWNAANMTRERIQEAP